MPVSGRQIERYVAELPLPLQPPPWKGSPGANWAQEHHAKMPVGEGKEKPHFSFSPLDIYTSMAFFRFFNFQATA